MTRNLVVLCVLFAVAVLGAAAGYNVNLSKPAVVNGTEIKAGNYKLELTGDRAVLRNGKTTVEADVTVEDAANEFDRTSTCCLGEDGKYQLREIRVGGTSKKVTFKTNSGMAVGK